MKISNLSVLFFLCHIVIILVCTTLSDAQTITSGNISTYKGGGRWDWTIFIKANRDLLNTIDYVEYKLHSSFPNQRRKITSIGSLQYPFALSTNGWGTFNIPIKIVFKNRNIRHLQHSLIFSAPPVKTPLAITVNNTASRVNEDWWNWKIFITGPTEALDQINCVEYHLHPTFPNPIQELCEPGNNNEQAFALEGSGWGTFAILIKVFLKTGQVQEMKHNLTFAHTSNTR